MTSEELVRAIVRDAGPVATVQVPPRVLGDVLNELDRAREELRELQDDWRNLRDSL